jgi:hypothetical protein
MTELAKWKQDYGRSENDRGQLRQQLEQERTARQQYEQGYQQLLQQQAQAQAGYNNDYQPPPTPPMSEARLEEVVSRAFDRKVEAITRQQQEATTRYWNAVGEIKKQPIYAKHEGMRQAIDAALADPTTQMQLAAGQRSPVDIVELATSRFIKDDYLRLLGGINPQLPGLPKPPHVEGAAGRGGPTPPTADEDLEERHRVALTRQRSGNAEEYEDLVATTLARQAKPKR